MDHINVKPITETTGRFPSTSHPPSGVTKTVQKNRLVIKREEKKKAVGGQRFVKL